MRYNQVQTAKLLRAAGFMFTESDLRRAIHEGDIECAITDKGIKSIHWESALRWAEKKCTRKKEPVSPLLINPAGVDHDQMQRVINGIGNIESLLGDIKVILSSRI